MAVTYPPAFEREVINGLKVIQDEVYESPLSHSIGRFVPIHGIRVLTLEDDTVVYGCRDCETVDNGPGKIRAHRRTAHSLAEDGATPKPARVAGGVGQVRAPGPDALSMTLHELLDLASQVEALNLAQEQLDAENLMLREQLTEERRTHREELAVVRREHREEITKVKADHKPVEKELAGLKAKLGKLIGADL